MVTKNRSWYYLQSNGAMAIGKDSVFVCLILYLMNYNYLLKRFKVFYLKH
ncbi:hypothetical protein AAHB62_30910 [Bacillus cereus]